MSAASARAAGWAPASALIAALGCALPGYDASGLELSWYVVEGNLADGEAGLRLRSCEGSLVSHVVFDIEDLGDGERAGRFEYGCDEGYQTPRDFFTAASPVFIPLRPGRYRLRVEAWSDPERHGGSGAASLVTRGEVELELRGTDATRLPFEIEPEPVDLALQLSGADQCDHVRARLMIPSPGTGYAEPEDAEDDEPAPYRDNLTTTGGWVLDGSPRACEDLLETDLRLRGLDRGAYLLRVQVDDGDTCDVPVRLELPWSTAEEARVVALPLDLANLPC